MMRAAIAVLAGVGTVAGATVPALRGVEPFASWYYVFAWCGTLLALDGVVAAVGGAGGRGGFRLLGRPAHLATLAGWSAVVWFFFEVLNLRLRNWYYVFVPDDRLARWTGVTLSFATVLPAVFVAEAALAGLGVARDARWPRLRVTPGLLRGLRAAGWLMLALPLLWPRLFFPLVWGAVVLLLEPSNYRRDAGRSLLGDLEAGRPGRLLRLLLGGAFIGLLWELFNMPARARWIYTVPGLEEFKLFEMPVAGFLGFPPFALECFVIWQALVLGGVAVPRTGPARPAGAATRAGAALAAALFCAATLLAMERRTISSYTPRLAELPGVPAAELEGAGYDVFRLAGARPAEVAAAAGAGSGEAARWIETARLATLRGIGTANARRLLEVGIGSVEELAAADPAALAAALAEATGGEVVDARVRVWVRAARRERGGG